MSEEEIKSNEEMIIYWAKQLEHKSLSLHEIVANVKWLLGNIK